MTSADNLDRVIDYVFKIVLVGKYLFLSKRGFWGRKI